MTDKSGVSIGILIIGACLMVAILLGWNSLKPSFGSAESGLASTMASTTKETVLTASAVTIAATSTNCSSRIVSSGAQAIILTFSDYAAQSPTLAGFGFTQPASTTATYDGALFGCGLMKAISAAADSVVTVGVTY